MTHVLEEADGGSDGLLLLKVGFPRPAFLLLPGGCGQETDRLTPGLLLKYHLPTQLYLNLQNKLLSVITSCPLVPLSHEVPHTAGCTKFCPPRPTPAHCQQKHFGFGSD